MPHNTAQKDLNYKQKQQLALTMRTAGYTLDQIAEKCGWGHRSSAHRAIESALDHYNDSHVVELRKIENERLDTLQRSYWAKAIGGNMGAATICLKVIEARCKLNGLSIEPDAAAALHTVTVREVPSQYFGIDAPSVENHQNGQVLSTQ